MPEIVSEAAAERLGLVYVTDQEPGIKRERRGRGFSYRYPDGSLVRDSEVKARINKLAIPPAYEDVWICVDPKGHLQATGLDARGRKQYRYHPDWQSYRSQRKYDQLAAFGKRLPQIRRTARRHAGQLDNRRMAVLGALVLLLDAAYLRAGSREYLEENGTYGATTLLKRHVTFGDRLELRFIGKGGRRLRRTLRSPGLQRILEKIADLPGRQLFGWEDKEGNSYSVDSGSLNAYLADIAGDGVSAKIFRTWGGTLAAFETAADVVAADGSPTIKQLCDAAAKELNNTNAVCRSSYVHPAVLSLGEDAREQARLKQQLSRKTKKIAGMRVAERRLLLFLKTWGAPPRRQGKG